MRSESVLTHHSREGFNRSVMVNETDERILKNKRHSENESVHSQLNRTFINGYFKQNLDKDYGDIAEVNVRQSGKRPTTSKVFKNRTFHKRSISGRPTTTTSQKTIKHKKNVSMFSNEFHIASPLKIQSFGIPGYKTPYNGLKKRTDKNCKIFKTEYQNYLAQYVKSKDHIPAPGKYDIKGFIDKKSSGINWKADKRTHQTYTELVMKEAKKNRSL